MDLKVRPISLYAGLLEWHMKQALALILFNDEDDPPVDWDGVTPVQRSKKAGLKCFFGSRSPELFSFSYNHV